MIARVNNGGRQAEKIKQTDREEDEGQNAHQNAHGGVIFFAQMTDVTFRTISGENNRRSVDGGRRSRMTSGRHIISVYRRLLLTHSSAISWIWSRWSWIRSSGAGARIRWRSVAHFRIVRRLLTVRLRLLEFVWRRRRRSRVAHYFNDDTRRKIREIKFVMLGEK